MMLTAFCITSCTDDDDAGMGTNTDRMFMTMFRHDQNTGEGEGDDFNCKVNDNSVFLCWYTVNGCAGYEIKWGVITSSDGQSAWEAVEAAGGLSGDTIIANPEQFTLTLKHLDYNTPYRFAIRVLHSLDKNDPLNSNWYGYGDGRRKWDYLGLTTDERYKTPNLVSIKNFDKEDPDYFHGFDVVLDRGTSKYSATDLEELTTQEIDLDEGGKIKVFPLVNGHFKADYMEITPNPSNPGAYVPEEYKHYDLKNAQWNDDNLVIRITGLQSNGLYDVRVFNEDIPYRSDACFNNKNVRVKGIAGPPILIKHEAAQYDTIAVNGIAGTPVDVSTWNACKITNVLKSFMTDINLSENQVFYLEGGKAYFISESIPIDKGFTLMTNPADIAAGKGKAKLYMGGIADMSTTNANTCSFQLSRTQAAGEDANTILTIDSIRFRNLDISCPKAHNYGHTQEFLGQSKVDGNYFINDGGSHMSYDLSYFEVDSCSFQNFVRGLVRVQTAKPKTIQKFMFRNSEIYNCGSYTATDGGFGVFSMKGGTANGNCYKDFTFTNNTIYDSSIGSLVNNYKEDFAEWGEDAEYNIKITNNTLVNFGTLKSGNAILYFEGAIPFGSTLTVENNLFIMARAENDVLRQGTFFFSGSRFKNGADGTSGKPVTCYVRNNYSTGSNLYGETGQIFSNYLFTATKDGMAMFADETYSNFPYGKEELGVHADDITNEELMRSPNPKHTNYTSTSTVFSDAYKTDNLDGLYYNNSAKVINSNIYKLGIGARKWREGMGR